jgi:hypothetical protein
LHACFAEDWEREPYKLSDKGRQVRGLLEAVHAADVPEDVLARRATLALAAALTPRPGRDLAREVSRLSDRQGVQQADLLKALGALQNAPARTFSEIYTIPDVRAAVGERDELADLLENLARARLVEMTLQVRCSTCGQRSWLPLEAAPALPACPGCGRPARYAHRGSSPEIAYRPSSLLTTTHANGGLVPAAATVRLSRHFSYVLPGVDMQLRRPSSATDAPPATPMTVDVDLLGWDLQRLFVGEAKTKAVAFAEAGFLDTLATLAAEMGADDLMLACPEKLPADLRKVAERAAAGHDLSLQLLCGRELLS